MLSRRQVVSGVAAAAVLGIAGFSPKKALAHHSGKKKFTPNPKYLPQTVNYKTNYKRGTIVVDPHKRFLYLVEGGGKARRYGVGVGRAALAWSGSATIKRKAEWPRWTPTQNMIRREPEKYAKFAGGVEGGPNNPLGARALYLYKGKRDTYYRIHGTNQPWTIGTASSNGCVRLINEHAIDLYNRTPIGTRVIVL